MDLSTLFKLLVEREGSDMFLRTNTQPRARINGKVEVLHEYVISKQEMIGFANFLLGDEIKRRQFRDQQDIDFIHEEEGIGRFRINIFIQRQTPALVARYVHSAVKSFEELKLPVEVCKLFAEEKKGLFLVTGPAGNGKSTTIAAMIEYINAISSQHIITIEDPIEYLFKDKKSLINQRELGLDVFSYPQALKHVTQQSPDIVYIGNIRDEETMRAAITATELGAFVMTTFHTINAVQTIIRIVNFFPPHLHDEIRMQLSMILKGTISLRLLNKKNGDGRIPAYETMVVTPTIARLIREGRVREIQNYIDEGELFGMQSFKRSLITLVKNGIVDEHEARKYAESKDDFNLELKGFK
ncbi:MAG: PilT/PilU family type 4a pilus ATPase [Candidatus Omnitrophica bacterium]|nr:PilT/PilU family type 4a pilus ATPase [Candidatus Omnitrophota bacterium]MCB9747248.1 PilT/PilU family type 4a pilus ATPase [Candidatus Omnitrophota bacterium]